QPLLLQQLPTADCLRPALLRQGHINPTRKKILCIPFALAMAKQYQRAHNYSLELLAGTDEHGRGNLHSIGDLLEIRLTRSEVHRVVDHLVASLPRDEHAAALRRGEDREVPGPGRRRHLLHDPELGVEYREGVRAAYAD